MIEGTSDLDWRPVQHRLTFTPTDVPPNVLAGVRYFMRRYRLEYGRGHRRRAGRGWSDHGRSTRRNLSDALHPRTARRHRSTTRHRTDDTDRLVVCRMHRRRPSLRYVCSNGRPVCWAISSRNGVSCVPTARRRSSPSPPRCASPRSTGATIGAEGRDTGCDSAQGGRKVYP